MKIFEIKQGEKNYPTGFNSLPNAPKSIYVLGDSSLLHGKNVAIVGTRKPTSGYYLAYEFAAEMVRRGFNIVSGLALGCDSGAHKGCMSFNGKTIAVVAQSLETPVFPPENKYLFKEILDKGGCILSENKGKLSANKYTLLARNRLQAALSLGTIIIETPIRSGTMITAKDTLELGRVLAVYESCNKKESFGGNRILHDENKAINLKLSKIDMDSFAKVLEDSRNKKSDDRN